MDLYVDAERCLGGDNFCAGDIAFEEYSYRPGKPYRFRGTFCCIRGFGDIDLTKFFTHGQSFERKNSYIYVDIGRRIWYFNGISSMFCSFEKRECVGRFF